MHPILLDFGTIEIGGRTIPLVLGGYGLMFALAVISGWAWIVHLGREIDPKARWTDAYFLMIVAGVVGAKATNWLVFLPDIVAGRRSFLGVLGGGGVWLGGVIIGVLVFYLVIRPHEVRLGQAINALFISIPFGHAVGRIGCLLAGCCYGTRCDLPWAVTYTSAIAHRLNGTPLNVPLHPTVVYEAALEMINFVICLVLWRRKAPDWSLLAVWAGLYSVERFFLEYLRSDARGAFGPFSTSQWISLAIFAVSLLLLSFLWRRGARGPDERS